MKRITFEIIWPILIFRNYVSNWLTRRRKKMLILCGVLLSPLIFVPVQIYVWYPAIGWPQDIGNWIASFIGGPILTCMFLAIPVGIFIGIYKLIKWIKEDE